MCQWPYMIEKRKGWNNSSLHSSSVLTFHIGAVKPEVYGRDHFIELFPFINRELLKNGWFLVKRQKNQTRQNIPYQIDIPLNYANFATFGCFG